VKPYLRMVATIPAARVGRSGRDNCGRWTRRAQ
jgi:hypothetical protein